MEVLKSLHSISDSGTISSETFGEIKVTKQGVISLLTKETQFVLEEGTVLGLCPQALDNFEIIIINWEK